MSSGESDKNGSYFSTPNHALLAGSVLGALMKAGIDAEPKVDDQGNYTGRLTITMPSGKYILLIEPIPS